MCWSMQSPSILTDLLPFCRYLTIILACPYLVGSYSRVIQKLRSHFVTSSGRKFRFVVMMGGYIYLGIPIIYLIRFMVKIVRLELKSSGTHSLIQQLRPAFTIVVTLRVVMVTICYQLLMMISS